MATLEQGVFSRPYVHDAHIDPRRSDQGLVRANQLWQGNVERIEMRYGADRQAAVDVLAGRSPEGKLVQLVWFGFVGQPIVKCLLVRVEVPYDKSVFSGRGCQVCVVAVGAQRAQDRFMNRWGKCLLGGI